MLGVRDYCRVSWRSELKCDFSNSIQNATMLYVVFLISKLIFTLIARMLSRICVKGTVPPRFCPFFVTSVIIV